MSMNDDHMPYISWRGLIRLPAKDEDSSKADIDCCTYLTTAKVHQING